MTPPSKLLRMSRFISPIGCSRSLWVFLSPLLGLFLARPVAGQSYGVVVSPEGTTIASKTTHTTGNTYAFRVQNEGTQQDTYTLTCIGVENLTCTNWPASLTLAGGTFQNVTVTFSTASQGTGQLYLKAISAQAGDTGWVNVPVVPPAGAPRASFLPYLEAKQDYGRCAASCFAATYAQSTVPYFSLDAPRNVTLVYHGDRVAPKPFVLVDAWPDSAYGSWPTEYNLQVTVNAAAVTFLNGEQTLRFTNPSSVMYRIGGQFTPPADSNGTVRTMEILVTAKYSGGAQVTNRMITRYLHLDEASGKVARGWTLAGIQRAFVTTNTGVLVTEGDGSATYFRFNPFTSKYDAPLGDFSRLDSVPGSPHTWVRSYPDSTKVTFNSSGLMLKVADPWGVRDSVQYDASNRVTQVKDHLNNAITVAYDANGLDYITDPFSRTTQVTVDASKRLTAIKDPDGDSTRFAYDAILRLQTITNRNAKATTLAYLVKSSIETNKLATVTAPTIPIFGGGTAAPVTSFAPWQVMGVPYQATAVTAFTPPKSDTIYARITEPQGASYVTKFTVNRWGSPLVTTNPLGELATVTYTTPGQPSTILRPGFGSAKDTLAYDASGLLAFSRPAGDSATTIVHGGWARPSSVTTPGWPTLTYSIGANGRVNSVTWGGTTRESYTYDSYGRLTKVTDALATALRRLGYPTTGTNRNLSQDTLPGPRVTAYAYDTYGRRTTVTPPTPAPQQVTHYNLMNWVDSVRVLTSPVTRTKFQYDKLGLDTTVTDPKNQLYKAFYNDAGWAIKQVDPVGAKDSLQYNVGGELKRWTNRRSQNVDFGYDVLHRMTSRSGTVSSSWSYTANSLVVTATQSGVATVTTYPNMLGPPDSAKTVANGNTFWQRYRYTSAGLDSVFFTGSQDASHLTGRRYLYNNSAGSLDSIRLGGGATLLGHDATLANTTVNSPGGANITRTEGSFHEPTKFTTEAGNNLALERWIGFDLQGRIDRHLQNTAKSGRWFEYDSLGQLRWGKRKVRNPESIPGGCPNFNFGMSNAGGANCTPVADYAPVDSVLFTYDSVGNRTDKGGNYGIGNRITAFDACTYKTDLDGNVVSRKGSSPCVQIDTLLWTVEGRLDSLKLGTTGIKFLYDADGRLTAKRVNGVVQAWFLWDGSNLLAQLNSTASAVAVEYSYYGMDIPHAVIKQPAGTKLFARLDGLGNVLALTNESSVIRTSYVYDDWGTLTASTDNEGFSGDDRARWKGALWMGPELDLYYMRNRWYEPRTGRFLSEDPIGLAGGINPVVFPGNDPVNGSDPTGLGCAHYYLYTYLNGQLIATGYLGWFCGGDLKRQGDERWGGGGPGGGRGPIARDATAMTNPPPTPNSCAGAQALFGTAVAADAFTIIGLVTGVTELAAGAIGVIRGTSAGLGVALNGGERIAMRGATAVLFSSFGKASAVRAADASITLGGVRMMTFPKAVADATFAVPFSGTLVGDTGFPNPFFPPRAFRNYQSCVAGR